LYLVTFSQMLFTWESHFAASAGSWIGGSGDEIFLADCDLSRSGHLSPGAKEGVVLQRRQALSPCASLSACGARKLGLELLTPRSSDDTLHTDIGQRRSQHLRWIFLPNARPLGTQPRGPLGTAPMVTNPLYFEIKGPQDHLLAASAPLAT
jgi:hypothetical protein